VLFRAEYPEESRIDTPEKRQKVRELFEELGIDPPPQSVGMMADPGVQRGSATAGHFRRTFR